MVPRSWSASASTQRDVYSIDIPSMRCSPGSGAPAAGDARSNDQDLARNLGLMSLGLGVVQLAAPRWFSNAVGVQPRESRPMIVRLIGLRELVTAAGLL